MMSITFSEANEHDTAIDILHDDHIKYTLSEEVYTNPTYPPDLAEVFHNNRNETHTDTCLWRKLEPDDKS